MTRKAWKRTRVTRTSTRTTRTTPLLRTRSEEREHGEEGKQTEEGGEKDDERPRAAAARIWKTTTWGCTSPARLHDCEPGASAFAWKKRMTVAASASRWGLYLPYECWARAPLGCRAFSPPPHLRACWTAASSHTRARARDLGPLVAHAAARPRLGGGNNALHIHVCMCARVFRHCRAWGSQDRRSSAGAVVRRAPRTRRAAREASCARARIRLRARAQGPRATDCSNATRRAAARDRRTRCAA